MLVIRFAYADLVNSILLKELSNMGNDILIGMGNDILIGFCIGSGSYLLMADIKKTIGLCLILIAVITVLKS